jgi:hypothetical protein
LDQPEHHAGDTRESVWSILSRWRTAYFALFAIQNIAGISLLCWYEITQRAQDSAAGTTLAVIKGIGLIGVSSATTAITVIETARSIMVIAASLEAWLQKRERARMEQRVKEVTEQVTKEVTKEVTEEVTAKVHESWSEWNRRRLEAEANGEPFDESPPDFDQTRPAGYDQSSLPPPVA